MSRVIDFVRRSSFRTSLCLALGLLAWQVFAAAPQPPAPVVKSPLSPADSLKHLRIADGLRVELVVAEPDVIDPIAMAFDEEGRLWVVEMTDYPNGPKPGEDPKSRIRLLEDLDRDGKYEVSHVFADKLLFATGVYPWRGGVIVTLAGEVAWMKDTDGDHKADVRERWFSGFAQQNPQLRANHPRFGLDNQIYIANGLRGGEVVGNKDKWGKETKPLKLGTSDFRFNPTTGEHELISGTGQFGMTFDDYANRFVCSNRNPCKHIILENQYIRRNPFLAVRNLGWDVSPEAASSRVFPLTRAWTTSTLHAGQFTAACGVHIYRGDRLPAGFLGNSFTCEPTGNLVHRDVLEPMGATFTSHYAYKDHEVLASDDEWFRPVNLSEGPDGALYVVDMYRCVIEHPQFVPVELKNRPDQDYGNTLGRIYRIVPKDAPAPSAAPRLSGLSAAELVKLLEHKNAWHRETAARLLYERQDKAAVAPLVQLAKAGSTPQSRVHALWALHGMKALEVSQIAMGLADKHPRVREQAVLLSEHWLADSPELQKLVFGLADDSDARLRFQVAMSVGEIGNSPNLLAPLADISLKSAGDEWTRKAVLSSVPEQTHLLVQKIIQHPNFSAHIGDSDLLTFLRELSEVVGSRRKPEEVGLVLGLLTDLGSIPNVSEVAANRALLAGLNGLGQGVTRRGGSLSTIIAALPPAQASIRKKVDALFAKAVALARNTEVETASRSEAIGVLQYAGFPVAGETLLELVSSAKSQQIRLRALDVLATYNDAKIGPLLIEMFSSQTPTVRRSILQALLRHPDRTRQLLDEIAGKRISLGEIDPATVRVLVNHGVPDIKKRARELLAAAMPADRKQVLKQYQTALKLKADAHRGKQIFEKNCSTCHRIGDVGVDVAPDIADSRTKTPAQLLTDILNPNQAIDNNYVSYTVLTLEGKSHTGIVATETASSITLRQPENKTVVLLRQDIEELLSNGVSLMPEGLEKNISVEQMADLISFIKNWRYLDGAVPLGEVQADAK